MGKAILIQCTVLLFWLCFFTCTEPVDSIEEDFLLVTVATEEKDGFKRFMRSTAVYNVPTKVVGMGQKWDGGDMRHAGGGHKVILFRKALKPFASNKNKIIMFTDSYDVVVLAPPTDIVEKFLAMDARVVFSAERYCWPDESLASKFPVTESHYKYLNSGAFIGYAIDLYELLATHKINSKDDDQLYYTNLFLNNTLREKFRMKLDYTAAIFQNLFGATDNDLGFNEGSLVNLVYNTKPLVLHGNGVSKVDFNTITNYLAKSWNVADGCISCKEDNIDLSKLPETEYPVVMIAVHVTVPTPFIREFFDKILQINYPKNRIYFFVYNFVEYHTKDVEQFISNIHTFEQYLGVKEIKAEDKIQEADARMLSIDYCLAKNCDYLLSVDSVAHLDNPATLMELISLNRTLVAPMLVRPQKAWSNFWGAITRDGFYSRSFDYMDIVNNERRGLWNVPYISAAYLINSTLLRQHKPQYNVQQLDTDMSFCHHYREMGVFMYVSNLQDFGHLVDPDTFDIQHTHPDMYELFTNRLDWEQRYISPEYPENFNPDKTAEQPCPDVYWFPVVTPEFCQSLIDIMEAFGKWSDGTNSDNRLVGGYENVPTRDIHMNQVGFDQSWMEFLRLFVRPLQEHVYLGYYHDPPRSLMNFVVRYRPDEQPSLRPHHDSSTYTINLALNRPNIDYQGGGCKFIRYNCSVTDTRVGWLLMHPGRLTHFHEGLAVTNGTRYIMISFVDP